MTPLGFAGYRTELGGRATIAVRLRAYSVAASRRTPLTLATLVDRLRPCGGRVGGKLTLGMDHSLFRRFSHGEKCELYRFGRSVGGVGSSRGRMRLSETRPARRQFEYEPRRVEAASAVARRKVTVFAARPFGARAVRNLAGADSTPAPTGASMPALSGSLAPGRPSMHRVTALLWVLITVSGAAVAEDAKPDTVEVHGKPLQLSCAEWKRNQDGSWTSIGALLVGTDTLTGVTLRGAKETAVLEAKCRNSSSPAEAPAPSGEPTRHTKSKKAPAAPT
jgi:hypothetical protein